MTNTDIHVQAEDVIKKIAAQLDQGLTRSLIDETIDKAVRQFRHRASCPVPYKNFGKIVADFMVQIYDHGLNARWKLSNDPLGEAIELLDGYYQSAYGDGYMAALLDANDAAEGGIDAVLRQFAEIIKDVERQKYVQGVFAANIDPANWYLQCEVAKMLLEDYKAFLPECLLQRQPWELASQIPTLVYMCLGSDSTLEEVLSYPGAPIETHAAFPV